jgi:hypothetical protein
MYEKKTWNIAIFSLGIVMIFGSIWLVRSQETVDASDYMEGMIPHHSIAILTSERAKINDIRVRQLADRIIKAQRKEIMEMEWLINDIEKNGRVTSVSGLNNRPIPDFEGSLKEETSEIAD